MIHTERSMHPRTLALAFLLSSAVAGASGPAVPPAPTRFVTDKAGVLSAATSARLEQTLESFEKETSNQFLVYTESAVPEGTTLEEYTVACSQAWKAGQAQRKNGMILFVFPESHKVRLEVGYGLEGAMPDALARSRPRGAGPPALPRRRLRRRDHGRRRRRDRRDEGGVQGHGRDAGPKKRAGRDPVSLLRRSCYPLPRSSASSRRCSAGDGADTRTSTAGAGAAAGSAAGSGRRVRRRRRFLGRRRLVRGRRGERELVMAADPSEGLFRKPRPCRRSSRRSGEPRARSFGEIRVHLHRGAVKDAKAEAEKAFLKLGMDKTSRGTGCLIFIAPAVARVRGRRRVGDPREGRRRVLARGPRRGAREVRRGEVHGRDRRRRREARRRPRAVLSAGRRRRPQRAARRRQRRLTGGREVRFPAL